MTEHLLVLLVCLAVIALLAILIYVSSRSQASALAGIYEVRLALQEIDRSLDDQSRVLYDAHKRISAVTKGVKKQAL